jgi:hypothetical protein
MTTAGERRGAVVEAEGRLLCGGGGETSWRMEVEDGRGCSFILFLAGLNPTLNPTLTNPNINRAWFWDFGGVLMLQFEVGLGLGSFFGVCFLVMLPLILPQILPQPYHFFVEITAYY